MCLDIFPKELDMCSGVVFLERIDDGGEVLLWSDCARSMEGKGYGDMIR